MTGPETGRRTEREEPERRPAEPRPPDEPERDAVDETLEDSFPSSDPPSRGAPGI